MAEAARLAPTLSRPTWIWADHQTGARGRQGRPWASQAGNLMVTLIYRPDATAAQAALRSFMAANALFEALALYTDRRKLSQKWPNDVLLNGGKVAGILLESSGGPQINWLAIGFGVNLAQAPDLPDAPFGPVSLKGEGAAAPSPARFLTELATNFATEEAVLAQLGFDKIRNDWLRHAARLGETITARTVHHEVTGTFETIDETGALVLRTAAGPQVLPAAEVFF